jgi:hypothetical protein
MSETRAAKERRLAEYTAKADALLKLGDSLGKERPAESRRTLRECRRYRYKATVLRKELEREPA